MNRKNRLFERTSVREWEEIERAHNEPQFENECTPEELAAKQKAFATLLVREMVGTEHEEAAHTSEQVELAFGKKVDINHIEKVHMYSLAFEIKSHDQACGALLIEVENKIHAIPLGPTVVEAVQILAGRKGMTVLDELREVAQGVVEAETSTKH